MSDECDMAADTEEVFLREAIHKAHSSNPKMALKGVCNYCFQPVAVGDFCDDGCRDDWDMEMASKRRNGFGG